MAVIVDQEKRAKLIGELEMKISDLSERLHRLTTQKAEVTRILTQVRLGADLNEVEVWLHRV